MKSAGWRTGWGAAVLGGMLGVVPVQAEVYEANGWRIEKTVFSVSDSNVTYYIDLTRTGPDAGVVAITDERDPAVTDGYGDDAYPPPVSGGGGARTIVWTQDMPSGSSTYAYLSTTLKPGLAPGTRIVNTASVTDSNGTTSVKQIVWTGRDNDTTRASGSAGTCRDPVNTRTGEYVYDPAPDFDLGGPLPLRFVRAYASRLDDPGTELVQSAMGPGWMHNFDIQLVRQDPAAADRSFFVILEGGKVVPFTEFPDGTWQLNLIEPLTPYALKSDGEDLWFCDPDRGILYRFDDADRAGVKEITDRNGNAIVIGHRADGLITNASDGLGRELTFEYNASSNLVRVTDGTRAVSFGYGAHGELVTSTNVMGQATAFAYDPANSFTNGNGALLTSVTYPRGNVPLVQTYDADGRVVAQADAGTNVATFAYGVSNFTAYGVVTEPDGSMLRHEYQNGALTKACDAYSNYFQYGFSGGRDALGSLRDRRGNDSRITRDYATRQVTEVQDRWFARTAYGHAPCAQVFSNREFPARTVAFDFHDLLWTTNFNTGNTCAERFECDARGNVTGYIDRAEQRWSVEVNARGQPVGIVNPRAGARTFAYNPDGTLASAGDSGTGATTFTYDALRRLTGIQYPDGSAEGWGLDARDRLTAHTNTAGGVTTFDYDANGNLAQTTDPAGYQTGSAYDAMDRRTNRWDSLGSRGTAAYDVMGRPAAVDQPACTNVYGYDQRGWVVTVARGTRTWTQHHDAEGNITNTVSPEGITNQFAYNWIGWPSSWYDPLYGRVHFQAAGWTYDYRGNVTRQKNQLNEYTWFQWDKANRLIAITNAALRGASFAYDEAGNLVTTVDYDGNTNTYGYTPMGRLAAATNALGEATRYEYDTSGRPVRTTYADGTRTETAYDPAGRLSSLTDENTNTWRVACDARGARVAMTNPAGGATAYAYNLDGTLQSVSDSDVGPISNRYDAARRLEETVWPGGASVRYEYNEHDELTGVIDALGNQTTFAYDADGRPVAMADPLGNTHSWSYDAAGRMTNMADRAGGNASWEYDAAGRLTAATDPTGVRTDFSLDANGRVQSWSTGGYTWHVERNHSGHPLALQTPLGIRTGFGRDALHRVTRITNGIGETTAIDYDSRGRVTALTDPAGRTTRTTYDPRGLPAAIELPDSNAVAYAWNAIGKLERLTDCNGAEWSFSYSPMGRLEAATDPLGRVTHYTYDADGRLAAVAWPGGGSVTNNRDANGRVVRRLHSGGPDLQFQRDALGRITNANDVAMAYDAEGRMTNVAHAGTACGATYDAAGRLATAAYAGGAFAVTYQYSTGYGNAGVLTSVSDSLTGTQIYFGYDNDLRLRTLTLPNGETITATWDNASRLSRMQSGDHVDLSVDCDLSGRITNMVGYAPLDPSGHVATAIAAQTYDAASQISSPGYAHDARGRVTATPERTFAWDGASRLTNANGAACAYDGLGHLRTRAEGGNTNRFFYNPAIAGAPLVAETDDATGAALRYYVWTPGGRLLYLIDAEHGNAVYFYHFDPTGNTLALTGTNRAVVAAYAYDPYGRILARTGTVTQPFTYSGAWGVRQDGDSGTLYQMRARWYDAAIGRFLTPEPLWPLLGQPKALNPYQYAGGDPVRFADPTGAILFDVLASASIRFTDEQLDAYLEGGMVGLAALLLRDIDLNGMDWRWAAMGLAMINANEANVKQQLHERFERRKAEYLARHPAPCHAQPFDSQPLRPADPAQDFVARLGRVPALAGQIVRYQPGAVQPPARPPAHPVDRTAADLVTGLFSPEALWDAQIEWHRTHPGQRLPGPLYDPPLPTGPQAGLPSLPPLTEYTADDLAAEIFFGPRALWEAALPPAVRRYTVPEAAHQPAPRAAVPPVPPAPNPGDVLDWMFGPGAVLDYARTAAAPPPEPDRPRGRNYPALMKARNAAFERVSERLQAGDAAGAREAMNDLKQAEQEVADYGRMYPFAPLYEK